jgi:hypothetical protein
LAVGRNLDGRLEVFSIGLDGFLRHQWQVTPGGVWTGEMVLGPGQAQEIAVDANQDGRLEIFYIAPDYSLRHQWQVSPGGIWNDQEVILSGNAIHLAVSHNLDGRLELFNMATNGAIQHQWQIAPGGSWNGTAVFLPGVGRSLTGTSNNFSVLPNQDGRLELVYLNQNSQAVHQWQVSPGGSWNGQESPLLNSGSTLSGSQIVQGITPDGRMMVVLRDFNGYNFLYKIIQTTPGGSWQFINQAFSGQAKFLGKQALFDGASNTMDAFFIGLDGSVLKEGAGL